MLYACLTPALTLIYNCGGNGEIKQNRKLKDQDRKKKYGVFRWYKQKAREVTEMGHTQAQNLMKRDVMCSIPPEVIHGVIGVIHTEQLKKKKKKKKWQ